MLRMTLLSQSPEETVVRLEGWLEKADVEVLAAEIVHQRQQSRLLVLEADGLKEIVPDGLALLECWSDKGLELRGGSQYIQALLKRHGLM